MAQVVDDADSQLPARSASPATVNWADGGSEGRQLRVRVHLGEQADGAAHEEDPADGEAAGADDAEGNAPARAASMPMPAAGRAPPGELKRSMTLASLATAGADVGFAAAAPAHGGTTKQADGGVAGAVASPSLASSHRPSRKPRPPSAKERRERERSLAKAAADSRLVTTVVADRADGAPLPLPLPKAFAGFHSRCSLCGELPGEKGAMRGATSASLVRCAVAGCGARYCCRAHLEQARELHQSASCGRSLPTPASVAEASIGRAALVIAEFGSGHPDVADAALNVLARHADMGHGWPHLRRMELAQDFAAAGGFERVTDVMAARQREEALQVTCMCMCMCMCMCTPGSGKRRCR